MATSKNDVKGASVLMLDPALLLPSAGNREIDQESTEFLALVNSVREVGVRIPIMATPAKGGKYTISAGHRRQAAALVARSQDDSAEKVREEGIKAGNVKADAAPIVRHCDAVPVLVTSSDWSDDVTAIENLHRRALTTGERIRLYESLASKGWTHEKIARTTGEGRPTITNCLGIRERLAKPLQDLLDKNDSLPLGRLLKVGGAPKGEQVAKWEELIGPVKPTKESAKPEKKERSAKEVMRIIVRENGEIETSIRTQEGGMPGSEDQPVTWTQPKEGNKGGTWERAGVEVQVRRMKGARA